MQSAQVMQVLEDYLAQLERGVPPHPEALLAQYPELAGSLKEYLASLEFLHRAARTRGTIATSHGELASRPYPGGGALYELEIYAAVDRCEGLGRGLYQYLPAEHGLARISDATPAVERLIEDAYFTIDRVSRPQVLLVLAARFQRVSWKYSSMTYALVLKDVGVMMQTMYLVATDMGLAPCALGGGNADLFAAATGLDYLEEGSVGEFALGTPAGEPPGADRSTGMPAP